MEDELEFIEIMTEVISDILQEQGFINKRKAKHFKGSGIVGSIVNKVKDYFTKRTDFNNISRKTLDKYGKYPISRIQIARQPILKALDTVVNIISLGKWESLKKKYNYDDLLHLGMIVTVQLPNGIQKNIMIEKIDAVTINDTISMTGPDVEYYEIPLYGKKLTLDEMVNRALEKIGPNKFFDYSGLGLGNEPPNNCQYFLMYLLENSALLNKQAKEFLFQDIEELAKEMPEFSKKIMNFVTDLGQISNKFLGKGITMGSKPKAKASSFDREKIGGVLPSPEEMEKLTPAQRRKIKSEMTKTSQIETKKRLKEEEEDRKNDPAYDDYYNKQDEAFSYFKSPEYIKERDRIKSLTPAQRARELRNLAKVNVERQRKIDEEEKRRLEEEAKNERDDNLLNKAFSFATDKIIDVASKGIDTFIPGSEKFIKKGATVLKDKLEGLGKLDGFELHAVVFPKAYGLEEAKKKAKEIIKDNKKKFYKETNTSYRFRNIPKTKFVKGSFKSKKTPEFTLIFGKLLK